MSIINLSIKSKEFIQWVASSRCSDWSGR